MSKSSEITIESTMVGPLYARAFYGDRYPEIFNDSDASRIIKRVRELHPEATEEFSNLERVVDEFLGLTLLIRARVLDDAVHEYIETHPKASVVNLGCGLDNPFSRVDNGTIRWYDLDLPDAIEYRLKLIPETMRSKCIATSVFDTGWFDNVEYTSEQGIFFIAGGLFGYFEEEKVSGLVKTMANHFCSGEFFFDVQSGFGNKIVNRRVRTSGGVEFKLAVGNPVKQLAKWSEKLEVVDWFPMFSRIEWDTNWSMKTKLLMKMTNLSSAGKFIHLKFIDHETRFGMEHGDT
jgi:O-methyltransferase involved in polyketide biosynthesis